MKSKPFYLFFLFQKTIRDTVVDDIITGAFRLCISGFPGVTVTDYRKFLVIAVLQNQPVLLAIAACSVLADTLGAVMVSKLIPSLINGGVAVLVTPLLMQAMLPALRRAGVALSKE